VFSVGYKARLKKQLSIQRRL